MKYCCYFHHNFIDDLFALFSNMMYSLRLLANIPKFEKLSENTFSAPCGFYRTYIAQNKINA